MAPWQRPAVWSEKQRIHLLDSMMRGISIGAITVWYPPVSETVEARPFQGTVAVDRPILIIDGQQRLTTLWMAALGALDHWRWSGSDWTNGPGVLTPSMAVHGHGAETCEWFSRVREWGKPVATRCMRDLDAVARTDLNFIMLDGSAEQMIEIYRRLATCGSPHSSEDLALMELWMKARSHD